MDIIRNKARFFVPHMRVKNHEGITLADIDIMSAAEGHPVDKGACG